MPRKYPRKEWAEHVVVVKKSHPMARSKQAAAAVAERHVRDGVSPVQETGSSFRVVRRPKRCFLTFRTQKRGNQVSVIWGKLKEGARRSGACR